MQHPAELDNDQMETGALSTALPGEKLHSIMMTNAMKSRYKLCQKLSTNEHIRRMVDKVGKFLLN